MLADKIAENMFHSFTESEEGHLNGNAEYKEAERLVSWAYDELKKVIPMDNYKLLNQYLSYINQREYIFAKEVYKKGFKDGAKLILELGK